MTDHQYVLDRVKVLNLLNRASPALSNTEEQLHPWYPSCFPPSDLPLMRLWDSLSGSQPDKQKRMNSRALNERLDTITSRETSLAIHINHRNWTPTPYVSFTSSPTVIEELAERRQPKRGRQTLTVIDPNTRLRDGLPILDLAAEMKHYNVQNPYGSQDRYCEDHYICLWQVTEKEIIGHWKWDELVESGNWYQDVVMPSFLEFTRRSVQKVKYSDLSIRMDKLRLDGQPTGTASRLSSVEETMTTDEIANTTTNMSRAGETAAAGGVGMGTVGPKIEVSRKSLVIEHMVKSVADLVEMYKNRDVRIAALEREVANLVAGTAVDKDVEGFIDSYKLEMSKALEDLKMAAAVIAAMPAVIDGDRGVIEAEIQPAAPIMRRADGTSIKDSLHIFARREGVIVADLDPGHTGVSEDGIWDSDKSVSDGFYYNTEHEDWDTDDEVEEANAADDMIKVIEGDW